MLTTGPFAYLPAGDMIAAGLADLQDLLPTLAALYVAMAWPRSNPSGSSPVTS